MTLDTHLEVHVDGDVTFEFTVRNAGDSSADLTFRSSKVADVVVTDDGEEVWRWSDGRMFAQVINDVTLDPDEAVTETFTWENPPAGAFEALATLEADTPVEAASDFSV